MTSLTFSIDEQSDSPRLETIVNPVTGDRMTLHIAQQNQGSDLKIRFDLPPKAQGSPLHYHKEMDETFTVVKGCLHMELGQKGNWRRLQPGESVRVLAGMHHSFCNPTNDWVTFTTENQPATGFEQFIRGLYGLAIDGKVNSKGMPTHLLQFAILLRLSDTIPVGIPTILFTLMLDSLVWVARVFKVERSLFKYWNL